MNVSTLISAAAVVVSLAGIGFAAWVQLGPRQRLRMAIELRSGIDESQIDEWNEMIRYDAEVILHRWRNPVPQGVFLLIGLAFTAVSWVEDSDSARLFVVGCGLAFILLGIFFVPTMSTRRSVAKKLGPVRPRGESSGERG